MKLLNEKRIFQMSNISKYIYKVIINLEKIKCEKTELYFLEI